MANPRIDASSPVRLALGVVATAAFFAARRLLAAPADGTAGRLSEREREVLVWTAAGRRQADIAATLGLSERTVENHPAPGAPPPRCRDDGPSHQRRDPQR